MRGVRYGSDTLRPITVITMKKGIQDWRLGERLRSITVMVCPSSNSLDKKSGGGGVGGGFGNTSTRHDLIIF